MNNALRSSPIGVAYTPEPIIKLPRSWSVQAFTELMTSFRAVYMQSSDRLSFKKNRWGELFHPTFHGNRQIHYLAASKLSTDVTRVCTGRHLTSLGV